MQTRRFGRTGHMSTVAVFGAVALGRLDQSEADAVMEQVIAAGVNHIDVAPSYGDAEQRLRSWMQRERDRFFLGCKTTERSKTGAAAELKRSLEKLGVDNFDLYQIHAVTSFEELDLVTSAGGALEAVQEAKQAGLTRYIGITGHGWLAPSVFLEALRRFNFDTVMFPLNYILSANPTYRRDVEALLQECQRRDIGRLIIKSVAHGPWGNRPQTYHTWYEPMADMDSIQKAVNYVLSQDVTGLCTAGDYRVLPLVLQACEMFSPLSEAEQENLIGSATNYEPIFA